MIKLRLGNVGGGSVGQIQKKLVERSSLVSDITAVYSDINNALEVKISGGNDPLYSQSELDWFVVEGYNRGLNVMFLGDVVSAEKILAAVLNMLPFCGEQVKGYSSDIRLAYRRAVDRKAEALPASAINLISFFSRLPAFANEE
eukprot:CAMPEP_0118724522 /NCGR_PEP_ID=MMETSP0800-20121206/32625_1 /TAXON_ID=210618 ORGANISM="Striatella unipunctata, Strain CCMP2910" /NCGR_SAMPLE_ID=MMETSP0800 /ASSEMBLY_ACC=CAM_ASM_000638 /LENGTH=143 /DNA_ID=CAMNT_0006633107 /DNA_START=181 /DNA_END=612 /DNA_ORIENTATION=-